MSPLAPTLAAVIAVLLCTASRTGPVPGDGPRDPHRDPLFTTSDACAVCHIAAPGASARASVYWLRNASMTKAEKTLKKMRTPTT